MLDGAKRRLHWIARDGILHCTRWDKDPLEIRPIRVKDKTGTTDAEPFLAWVVHVGDDRYLEHWIHDPFGDSELVTWYRDLRAAMADVERWVRAGQLARYGKLRRWRRRLSGWEWAADRFFEYERRRYYRSSPVESFASLLTGTVDYWTAREHLVSNGASNPHGS